MDFVEETAAIGILQDEVDICGVLKMVKELDDMRVVKRRVQCDFSLQDLHAAFSLELRLAQDFQCVFLLRRGVHDQSHLAIRTFAQYLGLLVLCLEVLKLEASGGRGVFKAAL